MAKGGKNDNEDDGGGKGKGGGKEDKKLQGAVDDIGKVLKDLDKNLNNVSKLQAQAGKSGDKKQTQELSDGLDSLMDSMKYLEKARKELTAGMKG